MRLLPPYLVTLIQRGGPFVGVNRSHARVTVEKNWHLNTATDVFTEDPSKLPFRWWQRADNSQVETEVPNVQSITWDRSVDTDAAACNIALYNQKMDPNMSGQNRMLGKPGYYGWRHRDPNATARWASLVENEWRDILIPNALLRTYEGYGGHDKTLAEAIEDGNLVLTGVWLVDEVNLSSDGMLNLVCRDMCKLLIEQQMYLPLMPPAKYPLSYARWRYVPFYYPAVKGYDRVDPSADDVTYGPGAEGRRFITDLALDADGAGYGLVGTDGGVFAYNTTFYGSRGRGAVGTVVAIASTPTGDGLWVADAAGEVIPIGNAPSLGQVEDWPVLVDITSIVALEPTHTGLGYWMLSDNGWVFSFGDASGTLGSQPDTSVFIADMARTANSAGYWLLAENGAVYAYGNAPYHGNAPITSGAHATGIAATSNGQGYWVVSDNGGVYAFGNAPYHGSFLGSQASMAAGITGTIVDAARTSDGGGYWMVNHLGHVYSYGNATYHGNASVGASTASGIAGRPQNDGYWVCAADGAVFALGSAPFHGRVNNPSQPIVAIAATNTGAGYWLFGADGGVFAFGDATFHGAPTGAVVGAITEADATGAGGYSLLAGGGHVYSYGNAPYRGNAPIPAGLTAVAIAGRPQRDGYWICTGNGAVYAMGSAPYHGGVSNPSRPIAAIIGTPSGNGYWMFGEDGGVFTFGDAPFHGSGVGINIALNKPIIDIVATPTNGGYWLIAADGGIFAYGDAVFHGSMGSSSYTVRAMARTPDGGGYWLVADGGAIEQFGNATDLGDAVGNVDAAPMRGFDMDPLGRGYWLAGADGAVFSFGEAVFYGRATNPSTPIIRLVAHPTGRGYWLLEQNGGVWAFGAAAFHGNAVGDILGQAVDMASTKTGNGYWIVATGGHVYAFGDAAHMGNATIGAGDVAAGMAARPQGDGYWIATEKGVVSAFGAAKIETANGDFASFIGKLNDPIIGMDAMPTGDGYILVAGDGGVFSFGTAPFEGSLPTSWSGTKRYDGNYRDFTEIIRDLLLWSGWLLYGAGDVYGNLESTGTYADEAFPPDVFDKKPVIDGINAVKELVGYHFWIDEEGGARFETPNWYTYGNFIQDTGGRTGMIPDIDERLHLTQYGLSYVDQPVRSEVIITSDDPTRAAETTITTRLKPSNPLLTQLLRGMVRPAMIPVPLKVTRAQQEDMARLIEIHMAFQLLQGQVSCVANPAIQVNDQVRIYERVTGETDVHYVRGVSSSHDLDTGVWMYELTTNRLGTGRTQAVTGGLA